MKSKRVIIIGFGSIGKRHYANLQELGYKNISVYDADMRIAQEAGVSTVKKLSLETLKNFDIAFICAPTNLHIKHALLAARAGCDLFIEKPLSHSVAGIENLKALCREKGLVAMVACNMRFHPCLLFLKQFLVKEKLGKVYGIRTEFGYYLPLWRPGKDYRKNYAAKRSTGGGIILDDIHEFDLLLWLNEFSPIKKSQVCYAKMSDLEIETEDIAAAVFQFENHVIGEVHSDYLQKRYTRMCKIIGEKGNVSWDWSENVVWFDNGKTKQSLFDATDFQLNDMYMGEIEHFLACVGKKRTPFNNLQEAQTVLTLCLRK